MNQKSRKSKLRKSRNACTLLSTNEITAFNFKWSALVWLVEKSVEGQNCYRTGAQWFQIAKTRHTISSLDVISRVFPSKFQQIYICFLFRGWVLYSKFVKTVTGVSIVRQFHKFFNLIFGVFLIIVPTVPCMMERQ